MKALAPTVGVAPVKTPRHSGSVRVLQVLWMGSDHPLNNAVNTNWGETVWHTGWPREMDGRKQEWPGHLPGPSSPHGSSRGRHSYLI